MKKILIVDDEPLIRTLLQETLTDMGCQVFLASNGLEGLEQFKVHEPQIIVADLHMPKMDGVSMIQKLNLGGHISKAIIVLTGKGGDAEVRRCFDLGVRNFLRKPVNLYELEGLVKCAFQMMDDAAALKREIREREKAFRQSEHMNHLLKLTVDALAEGVVTLDDQFLIGMVSATACQMLDVKEEEVLGKPAVSVLGAPIAGPSGVLMNCGGKDVFHFKTSLYCPSGAIIPVSLNIISLAGAGLQSGCLLILKDDREQERLLALGSKSFRFGRLMGCDPKMLEVFSLIQKIAGSSANVLISGESGVGKELAAREIHDRSRRAQHPFHAVSCAAIPGDLLESEFFGHEEGAFTGASHMKPGRLELAHKGALFLDEVGEIPLHLQGKLLRALQEQRFERVGGTKTVAVDVRIIAATNRNLEEMVRNKLFRADLFYRLHVAPIHMPPLRQRIQDIPLLASHFLDQFNKSEGRAVARLTPRALQLLIDHSWPGNIRELMNLIEYAFALSSGNELNSAHFPGLAKKSEPQPGADQPQNEREQTLWALQQANFNKGRAAALLGINRSTLYRREKKYGFTE